MIDFNVTITDELKKVEKAAESAKLAVYRRQGAYLRTAVMNDFKSKSRKQGKRSVGSVPGKPPYSWRNKSGATFKRTIMFEAGADGVVVGPIRGNVGQLGKLHEFGGTQTIRDRNGKQVLAYYPARPFMAPALDKAKDKLAEFWRDKI